MVKRPEVKLQLMVADFPVSFARDGFGGGEKR